MVVMVAACLYPVFCFTHRNTKMQQQDDNEAGCDLACIYNLVIYMQQQCRQFSPASSFLYSHFQNKMGVVDLKD